MPRRGELESAGDVAREARERPQAVVLASKQRFGLSLFELLDEMNDRLVATATNLGKDLANLRFDRFGIRPPAIEQARAGAWSNFEAVEPQVRQVLSEVRRGGSMRRSLISSSSSKSESQNRCFDAIATDWGRSLPRRRRQRSRARRSTPSRVTTSTRRRRGFRYQEEGVTLGEP